MTYEDISLAFGLDSGDDSGGNHNLLPALGQVKVMDSILVALVNVVLHLLAHVLGTNVDLYGNSISHSKRLPGQRSSERGHSLCSLCKGVPCFTFDSC